MFGAIALFLPGWHLEERHRDEGVLLMRHHKEFVRYSKSTPP
jgi:hypothetical protein